MKFSTTVSAGLMATAALAQPLHHAHKRDVDVVTVGVTNYVTVLGNNASPPTSSVAAAAATSSAAAVVEAASSEAAEAVSSSVPTTLAVATSAASSSSSAAASSSSSSSSTSAGSSGAYGITYSPYSSSGGCKSASEVASDLEKLTGFDVIRIYGVDCDQVANVYAAKSSSQKLFLGIYDVSDISGGLESIKSGINSDWDCVDTISIGNELVNSGEASVSEVKSYVDQAKSTLSGYGYTGPVVSVDTFIAVLDNPGLCDVSDYIAINAHAFFDSTCTASNAGEWALSTLQSVSSACSGKKVVITESGWPSQGSSNGDAVPGSSQQESAISALKSSVGNDVILFTAYNDLWKSPGEYGVEQYWGIISE